MMKYLFLLLFSLSFLNLGLESVFYLLFYVFFVSMMESMGVGYGFFLDSLGYWLIILSIWILIQMVLSSLEISINQESSFIYSLFMLILLGSLVVSFSVTNLLMFYLFFEISLVMIFLLVIGWGSQMERLSSGLYMMFYTLLGSLPFLFCLLSYYQEVGGLQYLVIEGEGNVFGNFWFFMLLVFLVSLPMYFVHSWLPKAHVEAPVAGSMILAGVLLSLGGYGMYRVLPLMEDSVFWWDYLMAVAILGGFYAGLSCLFQSDLKAMIAYSSVSHMGLFLGGLISGYYLGYMGGIYLLIGHGLCSSGLFCLVNFYYQRLHTRSIMLMKGMNYLGTGMVLWSFLLFSSNMSAPPSLVLLAEICLVMSISSWMIFMVFWLFLYFLLTGAYNIFLFSQMSHGKGWLGYTGDGVNSREYLLMFNHWVPLNLLFILISYLFI